jgi:hypothetical protein
VLDLLPFHHKLTSPSISYFIKSPYHQSTFPPTRYCIAIYSTTRHDEMPIPVRDAWLIFAKVLQFISKSFTTSLNQSGR